MGNATQRRVDELMLRVERARAEGNVRHLQFWSSVLSRELAQHEGR